MLDTLRDLQRVQSLPLCLDNKDESLGESLGESVLHAHEPQSQPQKNSDIQQEQIVRLMMDQFMDRFEEFITNVAQRELEGLERA